VGYDEKKRPVAGVWEPGRKTTDGKKPLPKVFDVLFKLLQKIRKRNDGLVFQVRRLFH
jgi:hypothetical protein